MKTLNLLPKSKQFFSKKSLSLLPLSLSLSLYQLTSKRRTRHRRRRYSSSALPPAIWPLKSSPPTSRSLSLSHESTSNLQEHERRAFQQVHFLEIPKFVDIFRKLSLYYFENLCCAFLVNWILKHRLVKLAARAFYDDITTKGDNQPKTGRSDNRGIAVVVLDALTRFVVFENMFFLFSLLFRSFFFKNWTIIEFIDGNG